MKKNRGMNKIIILLMVFFLFSFTGITGRFLFIQVSGEVDDVSLAEWAKEMRETEVVLKAERGKIYDQDGKLLVYNRPTFRLYAVLDPEISEGRNDPIHVVDVEETAEKIAPLIDMEQDEIERILVNGQEEGRFQVEFGKKGRNLSQQTMEEIKALELPGLNFMEDSFRYYANGNFASHIIGFTRPNEETNELHGVIGIEQQYNKTLSGTDGYFQYDRDKYNKKLLQSNDVFQEPENGNDIYLTINQKIQVLLEDVLSEVEEKYEPERMSAIVMNPKTGEILALSNRPSFNPNQILDVENWYNDAISTPVEPGSTVKIFTWAAAIDAGKYNGNELYQSGRYQVNQKIEPINDHNKGAGWGMISFDEGFVRSSNVAASKLMWEKLGSDLFYEYLQRFDFDKPTGIDLPNEQAGQILYNWPSEKLRTAFGQGSTVTAIQQLKAATALVNDGKMMQPFVVKKIVNSDTGKVVEEYEPKVVGEPIKKETAEKVIELMDQVVNSEKGTGKNFRLKDYSVIGKTGTAQIPDPNGRGYLTGRNNYIFSFLGMAPKEDPQLLIHVSVKQPKLKPTEVGSDPVSYIFNNVMENGLRYLNIEPDVEQEINHVETLTFPKITDKPLQHAINEVEKLGIKPLVIGDGKNVIASNYDEGDILLKSQKVFLVTDKPTMPNMKGWSMRDVHRLAALLDLNVKSKGNGFVVKQSIKAGKKINPNDNLEVKLSKPNDKKQ